MATLIGAIAAVANPNIERPVCKRWPDVNSNWLRRYCAKRYAAIVIMKTELI